MVSLISLPLQNLKKLREAVSWISFSRRLQRENNGIVTRAVRMLVVNRSAQFQSPAGLTGTTQSECRYQMRHQLTLKG